MRIALPADAALLTALMLNVTLSVTAVSLMALVLARGIFRRSPAIRYMVCLAGLVGLLLTPLTISIQQQTGMGLLRLMLPFAQTSSVSPSSRLTGGIVSATSSGTVSKGQPLFECVVWGIIGVWVIGVAGGLMGLAHGWRRARHLAAGRYPWTVPPSFGAMELLERLLGAAFPPIYLAPQAVSPMAVGILHPVILLPEGLPEMLTATQLRQVLLHEGAHIVHRHPLGGLIERVVRILFWPHPLAAVLCRELVRAREEICDIVASQEGGAACYARTLFTIAQGIRHAPHVTSVLAFQGPETSLEERIIGILDPRRDRMIRVQRGKLLAAVGALLCGMSVTAAVRVVAAEGNANERAIQEGEKPNATYSWATAKGNPNTAKAASKQETVPLFIYTEDGQQTFALLDYQPNGLESDANPQMAIYPENGDHPFVLVNYQSNGSGNDANPQNARKATTAQPKNAGETVVTQTRFAVPLKNVKLPAAVPVATGTVIKIPQAVPENVITNLTKGVPDKVP